MTNLTHNSFFLYVYFNPLHVSSNLVLIIRRINCINTTSAICHLKATYFSYTFRPHTCFQSDIYQTLCWYSWFTWWWARGCSKHVEDWNKHIRKKNCASDWSFTRIVGNFTQFAFSRLFFDYLGFKTSLPLFYKCRICNSVPLLAWRPFTAVDLRSAYIVTSHTISWRIIFTFRDIAINHNVILGTTIIIYSIVRQSRIFFLTYLVTVSLTCNRVGNCVSL
jgi:hypothetical protein